MLVTLVLSFILMAALFLMILAATALIQEKRLFTTAPKDIQAATLDHEEPFPGARAIGWPLLILFFLFIPGAFVYGGWDGIQNGYGFGQFFVRFMVMLGVSLLLGFGPVERFLLMILYITPVAAASYPMAQNMGGDGPLAGEMVVLSTVLSVVTLFLWIVLLGDLGLM